MFFDVILPTYNGVRWLEEAVHSVLAQTYPDWHLTIVDDASTDDTSAVIEGLRSKWPERISFLRMMENLGPAGARIAAIQQTSGDLLAFIDQDDRWLPRKLEKQVKIFGNKDIGLVHTDIEIIDEWGHIVPGAADKENIARSKIRYEALERQDLIVQMIFSPKIRGVSVATRRVVYEKIGGFDDTLFGGEEWEFWVRVANASRIGHVPEVLVQRREHQLNASRVFKYQRNTDGEIVASKKIATQFPEFRKYLIRRQRSIYKNGVLMAWERRLPKHFFRNLLEYLIRVPHRVVE